MTKVKGMELDYAYLAQEASWQTNGLDVIGAGWRTYEVDKYPSKLGAVLVLATEIEPWEAALPHSVRVICFDDFHTQMALGHEFEVRFPSAIRRYTQVVNLEAVRLERNGLCTVEIWLDGVKARSIEVWVRRRGKAEEVEEWLKEVKETDMTS